MHSIRNIVYICLDKQLNYLKQFYFPEDARKRRRRLGMSRALIPTEDSLKALKDVIAASPCKTTTTTPSTTLRRRSLTVSPKNVGITSKIEKKVVSEVDLTRKRSLTKSPDKIVPLQVVGTKRETDYLRKNKRLSDLNKTVNGWRERTKSDLAEIEKITAKCSQIAPAVSPKVDEPTINLVPESSRNVINVEEANHSNDENFSNIRKTQISPVLRRKSSEEPPQTPVNNIVSILKRKDPFESSSSSNASPVTFSSSVVDTPTRSSARAGILKKRSSLDESRFSRSQSPDERGILVRSLRRNSLEELQHGILKQSSYEAKNDITPQQEPHGILKKKETPTPIEQSKHVSIAEAVILAAAELCKDLVSSSENNNNNNSSDVKPILKFDTSTVSTPRPILKKKYSSETEEIRPILKSSRKSSREEGFGSDIDDCHRSILKIDSPAKRLSYCDDLSANSVLLRSKSLENPEIRNDIAAVGNLNAIEKPLISVAERIKSMENTLRAFPKYNSRNLNKDRFKTHPVTVEEINRLVFFILFLLVFSLNIKLVS